MSSVRVSVTITYRDDKKQKFTCWDTPGIGPEWITLYPTSKSPMGRELIPSQAVANISWDYEAKK